MFICIILSINYDTIFSSFYDRPVFLPKARIMSYFVQVIIKSQQTRKSVRTLFFSSDLLMRSHQTHLITRLRHPDTLDEDTMMRPEGY